MYSAAWAMILLLFLSAPGTSRESRLIPSLIVSRRFFSTFF